LIDGIWKMQPRSDLIIITVALLAWIFILAGGTLIVRNYESTPGPATSPSVQWPSNSSIPCLPGRITIVVFAHPRCPCTRASLNELRALLDECEIPVATHVLFWMPRNASDDWRKTELWQLADRIQDVQTHADEEGTEARHFGALTSGHIMIFRGNGTRIFNGGLTTARGRFGDGTMATAISQLINQETPSREGRPVFGCPLFDASGDTGIEPCLK
jgi:hypothetical protein